MQPVGGPGAAAAAIAQLVERFTRNEEVASSSLACGSGNQRFSFLAYRWFLFSDIGIWYVRPSYIICLSTAPPFHTSKITVRGENVIFSLYEVGSVWHITCKEKGLQGFHANNDENLN